MTWGDDGTGGWVEVLVAGGVKPREVASIIWEVPVALWDAGVADRSRAGPSGPGDRAHWLGPRCRAAGGPDGRSSVSRCPRPGGAGLGSADAAPGTVVTGEELAVAGPPERRSTPVGFDSSSMRRSPGSPASPITKTPATDPDRQADPNLRQDPVPSGARDTQGGMATTRVRGAEDCIRP